jgi:hypothetical protein
MIKRTYNFDNEKQAFQFDELYVKFKQHKKLSVEDAIFGIGRTATDKELTDFFNEEDEGEDLPLNLVIEKIKSTI